MSSRLLPSQPKRLRRLVLVLGEQLDAEASAFDGFDPAVDAVWMAEVAEEFTHLWSSRQRIALRLAAMRHFAAGLQRRRWPLHYTRLDEGASTLAAQLAEDLAWLQPQQLVMTAPEDVRVLQSLREVAQQAGLALALREDRHFYCSEDELAVLARRRRPLPPERFYREQQRRHRVLIDGGVAKELVVPIAVGPRAAGVRADRPGPRGAAAPAAGSAPCGLRAGVDAGHCQPQTAAPLATASGPGGFAPDALTREVLALVARRFPAHPGTLHGFAWPVTRAQALQALAQFVAAPPASPDREPGGDAAAGESGPWPAALWAALNLKLLQPREMVAAAEDAWRQGRVPLATAETWVRPILGWREQARALYRMRGPRWLERDLPQAGEPLPAWYWNGRTDMACLHHAIARTLEQGHEPRVGGLPLARLFAMLLGVQPRQLFDWTLALQADAVEWLSLPGTPGLDPAADRVMAAPVAIAADAAGGLLGQHIARSGTHCSGCRFDPAASSGERACPFNRLQRDWTARVERPRAGRGAASGRACAAPAAGRPPQTATGGIEAA